MGNVKRILEAILVSAILLGIFPTTALANGKTGPSPRGEITALGVTVGGAYVAASETAPSIQPRSLLPLTEKQFTLDLTGYFSEELKAVQLQAVVQGLTPLGDDPAETELSKYTVWAKRIYNDETGALLYGDGGYTKIGPEQTLDLSGLYGDCIFDLIVGTSNQLDPNNVRCVVNLRTSRGLENLLDFNAVDSTNQTAVQIYNRSKEYQLSDQRYLLLTDLSSWPEGESRLSFGFSDEWQKRRQDLTAVVYDGFYEKESDLPVDLASKNITAKVWRSGTSTPKGLSSHYADDQSPQKFTLVLKKNGEIFQILPFSVKMVPANVTVDSHIALWKKIEESEFSSYLPVALSNSQTLENGISYTTCEVIDNENLDDTLYLQILSSSPSDESESGYVFDVSNIKTACIGKLTKEEVENTPDGGIKTALFTENIYQNDGYPVNFSDYPEGVVFSVVDKNNLLHYFGVRLKSSPDTSDVLPIPPTPFTQDTYFQMTGADGLNAYVMPFNSDSSYYNGFQTVFLLTPDGKPVTSDKIVPSFTTGSSEVTIYSSDQAKTSSIQTSGQSEIAFKSGTGVHYTAQTSTVEHL